MNFKFKLCLGSTSPQRRELLTHLGHPFSVIDPEFPEESNESIGVNLVLDLAHQKSLAVFKKMKRASKTSGDSGETFEVGANVIITADTVVVSENKVLGKPRDKEEARDYLMQLSGGVHQVYTGVQISHFYWYPGKGEVKEKKEINFFVKTDVLFCKLGEHDLADYINSNEWEGKAGAYAIQGKGASLIVSINGSYSNVIGLPLWETKNCLESF